MKVLIAHNRYRLSGGEETHVALLERGLRDLGVGVRTYVRSSSEFTRTRRQRFVTALGLTYRPGGGGIANAIDDWHPDVVHFHNIWPALTPAALRLAHTARAAVVLTVHNYRFACPGGLLLRGGVAHDDCLEGSSLACGLRNARGSILESAAYGVALEIQRRLRLLERWVDAFVAPSAFMADALVRAGIPSRRVHVIGNAIPAGLPLRPRGSSALFSGRLSPEKGIRVLLEASQLAPDVQVVVAGSGPCEAEVLRAPVRYLGHLDAAGVAAAMEEAAFTLAPSQCFDNQPYSVIESLAAGRPVIASEIGGLPEVVIDGVNGLLVPAGSPQALAKAMQRLSADQEL